MPVHLLAPTSLHIVSKMSLRRSGRVSSRQLAQAAVAAAPASLISRGSMKNESVAGMTDKERKAAKIEDGSSM